MCQEKSKTSLPALKKLKLFRTKNNLKNYSPLRRTPSSGFIGSGFWGPCPGSAILLTIIATPIKMNKIPVAHASAEMRWYQGFGGGFPGPPISSSSVPPPLSRVIGSAGLKESSGTNCWITSHKKSRSIKKLKQKIFNRVKKSKHKIYLIVFVLIF